MIVLYCLERDTLQCTRKSTNFLILKELIFTYYSRYSKELWGVGKQWAPSASYVGKFSALMNIIIEFTCRSFVNSIHIPYMFCNLTINKYMSKIFFFICSRVKSLQLIMSLLYKANVVGSFSKVNNQRKNLICLYLRFFRPNCD